MSDDDLPLLTSPEPGHIEFLPAQPTLHDRYTMAALTGLLANSDKHTAELLHFNREAPSIVAAWARQIADECLRQREAAAKEGA